MFLILLGQNQVAPFDPAWLTGVGQIGASGVMVWLIYHIFTRTLPDRDKRFVDSVDAKDKLFTAALEHMRHTYSQALAEECVIFTRLLTEQRNDCKEEMKAARALFADRAGDIAASVDRLTRIGSRMFGKHDDLGPEDPPDQGMTPPAPHQR